MPRAIEYTRTARREIVRLNKRNPAMAQRILKAIAELAETPTSGDVKRLTGTAFRRRRVGDWRIVFECDDARLRIIAIGHRKEIYRRRS
jgi:mRNA interferase RelE/StbE